MPTTFAITWDYRCPFARNAHEHVLAGLDAGADWDVRFVPFSLDQTHVAEGDPAVWEVPERYRGLLPNLAGVVVRDLHPEQFLAAHLALFTARHDSGRDVREREVVSLVLDEVGVDGAAVLAEIDAGWPLERLRDEHQDLAQRLGVFGVPTFVLGDDAAFVRLMHRPAGDGKGATETIERVLDLVGGWADLNELKHARIPR
jgi:hypothetical protein